MDNNKKYGNLSNNLLSPQKLAEYLGVSVGTIYGWIFRKTIPYLKIGRLVRFNSVDIDEWLKHKKIEMFGKA